MRGTCERCIYRDYGTDSHYVCVAGFSKYLGKRCNKKHKACIEYNPTVATSSRPDKEGKDE